jgi:hypothetical protein
MKPAIHHITAGLLERMKGAHLTGPRLLHNEVMALVTSFLRDDRWVPGLQVYVTREGELIVHMMGEDELAAPGRQMANVCKRAIEDNDCVAMSLAIPSTRFVNGTMPPSMPNSYRLSTYSNAEAPLTSLWRLKMKKDGTCVKHQALARGDVSPQDSLTAAHWALLFPECPITPECVHTGAAYYSSTYVEPEDAVLDLDFTEK